MADGLLGAYEVVEIDGSAVTGRRPTIEFGPTDANGTGRIGGRAPVNRFHGSYTLDDDVVTVGPAATTMMAGPPEAMAEERRFFDVLTGEPLSVEVRGDAVVLRGTATSLRLERPSGDDGTLVVRGSVLYRERIAMPTGAVVRVQLVSTPEHLPGDVVATTAVAEPGQVPVPFELRTERSRIPAGSEVSVEARIEVDGDLWWRSDEIVVEIGRTGSTTGEIGPVDVVVRRMPG